MAKKLTKNQQEQLEKQNAHQSMMAEAQTFIDSVHEMQEWQNGTPEYQTEMLDYYENNIWVPYAKERWGDDVVTANSYKNSFLQPLRSEIAKHQTDMNTWGNTLSNALASVQRGGDMLLDAGHAIAAVPSTMRESINYNRIVELQNQMRDIAQSPGAYASPDEQAAAYAAAQAELDTLIPQYEANRPIYEQDIQNLAQELATSGSKEAQRRAAIPQRMNDYIRQQEIERREKLEGNEDPWTVWHLVAENPRYLANLILEQGANRLPQLAAATAGGLVAGPVGGTVASSAVGSLMGAGQVASGIAEEIFNADVNTLAGLPQYDELRKLGYSDRDARIQIAAKAIEEAVPGAAALTAATSIIGPETMLAKSSILQPLIKGGALRRVATAGALSAPGEAVEEGGQQVFQNIGWNVGTGDQRDIMQGVGEAASLGALLGGVMGGAGGIRRPSDASGPASNDTTPPPVQGQPTPEPTPTPTATNLSGGSTDSQSPQAEGQPALSPILNESSRAGAINVPGQTVEGPVAGGVDNVNYNPSTTERAIRASEVMRLASEQVDAISANPSTDPMALYGLLMEAENLGVNPDFVDGILGNVQDVYNRDPNNTGDVRATYESVRASTRKPSGDTDVQQQDPLQPTVLGQQGQADQGGSDTGGTSTGSRPAAAPTGTDQSNITTGTQAAGGTDAAAQGSGSGGTAYTGAGTPVGNVQTNQSVGRSSGQGANSGRDNSPNGPGNAQSDSGNGGDTTTPEQRTSDGGRAQQSGGTQTGGVDPNANNVQVAAYVEQELTNAGRTPEQAQRETIVLLRMLNTLGSVSGLTPAQQLQRLRFGIGADTNQVVNRLLQEAWHGSPHIFDKFTTNKIGSGEGAQVHGWGLYFALLKKIADERYRQRLSGGVDISNITLKVNGTAVEKSELLRLEQLLSEEQWYLNSPTTEEFLEMVKTAIRDRENNITDYYAAIEVNKEANKILNANPNISTEEFIEKWKAEVTGEVRNYLQPQDMLYVINSGFVSDLQSYFDDTDSLVESIKTEKEKILQLRKYIDSANNISLEIPSNLGQLYRVEIPDNNVLLNEQAKFTEQPKFVQNTLRNVFENIQQLIDAGLLTPRKKQFVERLQRLESLRGFEIYKTLEFIYNSAKEASLVLNHAGIKGITYDGKLDDRCFVIFDDSAVKILETFYQTNERGRIDFLNDGTMNILFGENADASTAIHEFQHMFVMEALHILNDPTIPGSPQKAQLMADMIQLAKFAGIKAENATDFNAWTVNAHEKVARAFEQYFRNGVAPTPELDGLFAKMRELLMQIYQRAKMLLNRSMPAEVQKVFDRQLTGYDSENTISLSMPNPDGTYSVREYNTDTTTVEDILNEVNTSLAAQADAAADAAAANAATIAEEAYANPDNLMAQAKLEAAQDPADMTSPLVVYADMDEQMLADIANGNYPAEVQAAIQDDNSILTDVVSTTVRGTDSDLATPVQPTPEEEAAVHEQLVVELNEGLAEGNVTQEGEEFDNGDGTTTILSLKQASPATQQAAQAIQDLELRASLQRGAEFRAAQVEQVSKTVYAGAWKPGLWAKAATWLRKHMVDGGAHFYLFTLQHFSPVNADPANNPVWKTFSTLSNNIYGAAKIFTENVLNPIQSWSEGIARQYNIDPDKLAHDAGLYRTCLHTIEAAYKRQIELENDLQKAYAMPAGQAKADAVITAEEALERFADRQMGKRKDVDVYGGRSVAEAQAEIDRLISEMDALTDGQGRALLDEGNAHIHNGLRWITRWLMENGQLSEADALRFDDWNYYTPLTIETLANDKANSDIFYYAPRQNFHRNGSTTPAQDGYQALIQYGCRASRSVGMSEFSYVMYEAYQTLKARGNLTGKLDGINFYDGMGLMPTDYINAVAHGDIHASNETVTWAKGVQENATTVIRVVQPDPNTGISTTKSYYVMFAKLDNNGKIERDENVAQAVRNPFKAASPHVFLDIMAKTTSGYAQIYTRLRPYFPVLTSVRDMIERLSYIPTRVYTNESGETVQGYKIAAQMVGFAMNPANFYRLVRYWTSGTSGSSYFDQHMDDFFNSGADMSGNYNKMLSTLRKQSVTAIENNIPSSIQRLGKKRVKEVVGTISKWGDFFYSLPAFAQFIKMRENKIDMRQTVYGITTLMNMQQRGNFAGLLGTIYPFVNSIGQTASNLLYTMGLHTLTFGNHPNANRLRVSAIQGWAVMFGTYAAMRVLIPHVAASLMGDDEDKEKGQQRLDMIPLGQFATFIPVGVGDGSYVKWPTGFGPAAFGNLFAFGIDRIERGKLSYGDFMATALTTFGKSLVPNSMPAFEFSKDPVAFIIQSMTPMLGAPAMQIATNRTYSGQQITYDTYNRLERSSDKQNITAHMVWSEWAKNLYKYTDGMWDLTPEEVRTGVSGYLGGVAQGLVSWLEADPLYKHPMYETTREKLGPFWTAFGATSIYNAAINLERTAYYEAREHYEKMIRASGVGSIIEGDEQDKRKVLAAAGFTQSEIDDYINLSKTEKYLSDMNSNFRKELDKLYGPDMEESVIRQKFSNWSMEQHRVFSELMPKLNFYNPDNRRRWGAPDEQASRELRGEVPFSAVEPGTTTLNNRTIPRNTDGSIAAQATHIIQDVDGLQVIIPTIGPNGERWTIEQAMDNYFRTKQHLGKYRSMEAAQKAVETLQR